MKKVALHPALHCFILWLALLVSQGGLLACGGNDLPPTPLHFVENAGQWESNILFQTEMQAGRLYLEAGQLTYLFLSPGDLDRMHELRHEFTPNTEEFVLNAHAVKVHFEGANPAAFTEASCMMDQYRNYYIGNDPSKWASHVGQFGQIDYRNLYDGIDMRYYGVDFNIKYDYIVSPGADASQIRLRYEGADGLSLVDGALHVATSVNTLVEQAPYAYQNISGQHVQVACNFAISGNELRFVFPDGYDTTQELIIDPLIFSTYTGSTADNWGFTATYDNEGFFYAGGAVFNIGYPTTTGAFQMAFAGGVGSLPTDIGITKYTPDGTALVYSTYIGGGTANELPHSIIVNNQDELILFGTTGAADYPTTAGAYDQTFNGGTSVSISNVTYPSGSDIILSKFSADGTMLLGSTYIGGFANDGLNTSFDLRFNYADEGKGEVVLDNDGNIYIASSSFSPDLFVPTVGGFAPNYIGGQDGCLIKMNPSLTQIEWANFIGGTGDDAAYSIVFDEAGTLYVAGGTSSTNFPVTADALITTAPGGRADGWIAKISPDGETLQQATYLGTSGYDQANFVDLDEAGNVYTVGQTDGDYPIMPAGVYNNPNSGQFLHKLGNNLDFTQFSTVFGNGNGGPNIAMTAFLVDVCNQIYVSGWGGNTNGGVFTSTTNNLPITPDAFQSTTDGSDFYFIIFSPDAQNLVFASYFGGFGTAEHVDGGTSRFDKEGVVYQAVCAGCGGSSAFPTTPGAWSQTNNSGNCNLGSIKYSFETAGVEAIIDASEPGCAPSEINFSSLSANADDVLWDFGDGSPTTSTENPTHTYAEGGEYTVSLIAFKPGACNGDSDTATLTVVVGAAPADVEISAPDFCMNDEPAALTTNTPGGIWSGVGISDVVAGIFDPEGLMPGQYTVTYTVGDDGDCLAEASVDVNVLPLPDASFEPVLDELYCGLTDIAVSLVPATPGGEFSGPGVSGSEFVPANTDPSLIGETITIWYVVTQDGCTDSSSQSTTVYLPPSAAFSPADFCTYDDAAPLLPEVGGGAWSGEGVDPETGVFDPSGLEAGAYEITYTIGLESCSNSSTETVTVIAPPSAAFIPLDFCADSEAAAFTPETEGGTWSGEGVDPETGVFDPSGLAPGIYEISYTAETEGCAASSTELVTVYGKPEIVVATGPFCLNDGTAAYELAVIITDGTDGGESVFELEYGGNVESGIAEGEEIVLTNVLAEPMLTLVATNTGTGCSDTLQVTAPVCPECFPDAGIMPGDPQTVCHDGTVAAQTSGEVLEEGQVLAYVLHSGEEFEVGNVQAINFTGSFEFDDLAGGEYYEQYYISAIVGFPGENGFPIFGDGCTVVATGTPVLFFAPVTFIINEYCDWLTGEFLVTTQLAGGLPQYEATETYSVSGDYAADVFYQESFLITIPEDGNNIYSFMAVDNWGCSAEYLSEQFICIKTPIELTEFAGKATENGNLLAWTTGTETENDFFTLESSHNAIDFRPIATVEGAGNSLTANSYEFLDKNAFCGTTYYRLSWTDFNGVAKLGPVVAVRRSDAPDGGMDLWPVPAGDFLDVTLAANASLIESIEVLDAKGAAVAANAKTTAIDDCSASIRLEVDKLLSGVYFVRIVATDGIFSGKFVKR